MYILPQKTYNFKEKKRHPFGWRIQKSPEFNHYIPETTTYCLVAVFLQQLQDFLTTGAGFKTI